MSKPDQSPEFQKAWDAHQDANPTCACNYVDFLAGYTARDAEVARLREALGACEWIWNRQMGTETCPICFCRKQTGHSSGCSTGKALAPAQKEGA